MSRSKKFIAGTLTGYGRIGANIVFTLASVPLALHYLDKQQFGLWALALQITGFLALIDLGMSGAVSRFIADHKDDMSNGQYGSNLQTGALVFLIQGIVIGIAGVGFSWFAPAIFGIPDNLATTFRLLLIILSSTTAFSIASRALGAPLWAFQRSDLVNTCSAFSLLSSLALLWLGFALGWGVMSFAFAPIPPLLITQCAYIYFCIKNQYYPSKRFWGRPSLDIFKKTFSFAKDTMLIQIAAQLVEATQIIIISRWIGLEAAATYAIATKFYTLAMQLVTNPVSTSASGLTELFVRGEKERFVSRYWDLIKVILLIATVAGVSLAAGNRSMIALWTNGSIQWPWYNDLMLGLLIVMRNLNGCFIGLFGVVKNWRPVRFLYFAEGILFVPLAILGASYFGITGVLGASIIAHLLVTNSFSAKAAMSIIGLDPKFREVITVALISILFASAFSWTIKLALLNSYYHLVVTGLLAITAAWVGWFWILPISVRIEAANRSNNASRMIRGYFKHTAN